jgi:hypothetical protein
MSEMMEVRGGNAIVIARDDAAAMTVLAVLSIEQLISAWYWAGDQLVLLVPLPAREFMESWWIAEREREREREREIKSCECVSVNC